MTAQPAGHRGTYARWSPKGDLRGNGPPAPEILAPQGDPNAASPSRWEVGAMIDIGADVAPHNDDRQDERHTRHTPGDPSGA